MACGVVDRMTLLMNRRSHFSNGGEYFFKGIQTSKSKDGYLGGITNVWSDQLSLKQKL